MSIDRQQEAYVRERVKNERAMFHEECQLVLETRKRRHPILLDHHDVKGLFTEKEILMGNLMPTLMLDPKDGKVKMFLMRPTLPFNALINAVESLKKGKAIAKHIRNNRVSVMDIVTAIESAYFRKRFNALRERLDNENRIIAKQRIKDAIKLHMQRGHRTFQLQQDVLRARCNIMDREFLLDDSVTKYRSFVKKVVSNLVEAEAVQQHKPKAKVLVKNSGDTLTVKIKEVEPWVVRIKKK